MNKFFIKSKTILGILVAIAPSLLPIFGIGANDVTLFTSSIDQIIQGLGALFAIFGRVMAGGLHFGNIRNLLRRISSLALLVLLAPLVLSACAGAVPWNKQNYAGMEEWSVEYQVAEGTGGIKKVHYINGKEFGASDIKIALADGTVLNFAGDDIRAFEGQELRAEVEKVVAEQFGDVAPGVIDAIIDALVGS